MDENEIPPEMISINECSELEKKHFWLGIGIGIFVGYLFGKPISAEKITKLLKGK